MTAVEPSWGMSDAISSAFARNQSLPQQLSHILHHLEDVPWRDLQVCVHDIAKEMPNDLKIKYCEEHGLEIDDVEKVNPGLLHGKIGAHIAKTEFGYSEEEIQKIDELSRSDEISEIFDHHNDLVKNNIHAKGIPTMIYDGRKHTGKFEVK